MPKTLPFSVFIFLHEGTLGFWANIRYFGLKSTQIFFRDNLAVSGAGKHISDHIAAYPT